MIYKILKKIAARKSKHGPTKLVHVKNDFSTTDIKKTSKCLKVLLNLSNVKIFTAALKILSHQLSIFNSNHKLYYSKNQWIILMRHSYTAVSRLLL